MNEKQAAKDRAKILARAEDIRNGAQSTVRVKDLERALKVWLDMWHLRWRCHGETHSYIRYIGVRNQDGTPTCGICSQSFTSNASYARHMLGYGHQIKPTTREALDEVRAHLQAFPMPKEVLEDKDTYKSAAAYQFNHFPDASAAGQGLKGTGGPSAIDGTDEAGDGGPWHAYLEDDEENNSCVYVQREDDRAARELHEMVEHDVRDGLTGQDTAYLREAEDVARERNREEAAAGDSAAA